MAKIRDGRKFFKVTMAALVVGAIVYLVIRAVFGRDGGPQGMFPAGLKDYIIDFYLSQLSMTFITITVTSALSDNGNIIYWENIAEKKLISPTWTCFLAYTSYSFVTILYSTIAIFIDGSNAPCFFAFFFLDVISLLLLTLNMVDVYYNRDEKKEKLRKDFVSCAEEVSRRKEEHTLAGSECSERFLEMILGMRQQTVRAVETYDYKTLQENLMFIAENRKYFQAMDDGVHDMGTTDYIFSCLNDNTMGIVNECIRVILAGLEKDDWRTAHKIVDGLQEEKHIMALTENLNPYNVGNYMKNLRDACLAEVLMTRSGSKWSDYHLTEAEEKALFATVGTKNEYFDGDVIKIADEREAEAIADLYLDRLEPLFGLAQKNKDINYKLGQHLYDVSCNIPLAADRVFDKMQVKTVQRVWRISCPGEPDNERYGEVLEFFPGGNGRAYRTIKDYHDGEVFSNLTYDNSTGYICVRYLESGRSVIFQLDGDFLRGDNDEVIYGLMDL